MICSKCFKQFEPEEYIEYSDWYNAEPDWRDKIKYPLNPPYNSHYKYRYKYTMAKCPYCGKAKIIKHDIEGIRI